MKKSILTLCMLLGILLSANAQKILVSGIVRDDLGGFSGATIKEKGTANAAIADINGHFSLSVSPDATLVVSAMGKTTQEVEVKNRTYLEIFLLDDDALVTSEVVKIGYVEVDKKSISGSATAGSVSINSFSRNYSSIRPQLINDDSEEYGSFVENRFLSAKKEPLSTFSLDVDAASYSNIRRKINQGRLPDTDAVRIEEMINYFSYDYPKPNGEHPVNIIAEAAICPWQTQHQLVRIGIKAKEIPSEELPLSNLVFLIDVSGSMSGADRLDLVKKSMKLLTNNLREKDRVAIVVYADATGEVLPSTSGSDRQKILDAIENLSAGGSTAGGAGIRLAYKVAEKNFIKDGNNRVILCTDGDFNVGMSSVGELEQLIENKRKENNIFLTVLGYGMGNYKDNKLQTLAQKGNGNHAYIDNIQEANKVLVNEFGSTIYTVAKDVKIQIEFNPYHVNAYRLIGYESRLLNKEDFNDDTKDAGELGAGHTVTALYEIMPVGIENPYSSVDDLKYQKNKKNENQTSENAFPNEVMTVKLRYKEPNSSKSQKMEIAVPSEQIKQIPSDDFKFATAVAMFGQLLRKSDFKGSATYQDIIDLANSGIGDDPNGYRKEFVRMVEVVNQLEK